MTENSEEWAPKTRDDWVGMFSDAMQQSNEKITSAREEAEAKKAAETQSTGDGKDKGGSDNDIRKLTLADRLLGRTS